MPTDQLELAPVTFDPSQPIENVRHEEFARLIFEGKNGTEAYRKAFPDSSYETAMSGASTILRYPKISARIAFLQSKTAEKSVLSAIERREWLADLVRTPADRINGSSPLCAGVKPLKDGQVQYLVPDKVAALKLDALLSGDLAQAGAVEVKIAIFQAGGGEAPAIEV